MAVILCLLASAATCCAVPMISSSIGCNAGVDYCKRARVKNVFNNLEFIL